MVRAALIDLGSTCAALTLALRTVFRFYHLFVLALTTRFCYSVIWNKLLVTKSARETGTEDRSLPSFSTRIFPDLSRIHGRRTLVTRGTSGGSSTPSVADALASFATNGPLLPRLILTGALSSPIFAISLQRDTVDIGGNQGMLSIGELPVGMAAENLTWVPLRGYTVAEGGLPAPEDSPNEVQSRSVSVCHSSQTFSRFTPSLGKLPWMMCISTGESCHGQPLLRRILLCLPCLTQFVPYLALRCHS
jgi:hypothetical protein